VNALLGWLSLGLLVGLLAYVIVRYVRSWRALARTQRKGGWQPPAGEDP
jgi:hypothetical protein